MYILDVWSAGCVLAELLLGRLIFRGESGVDLLVEIIKVLGTPTQEQIYEMNKKYAEFNFPQIKAQPLEKVSTDKRNLRFLLVKISLEIAKTVGHMKILQSVCVS